MPTFKSIVPFVPDGSYSTHVPRSDISWTLDKWKERTTVENKTAYDGLILDPDFQRPHVWTQKQQIACIEYALRGGRSGRDIYWNNPTWHTDFSQPTVLVAGKQRIEAVLRFLDGTLPAFGHKFNEWNGPWRNKPFFIFSVNNLPTRKEVLQWYLGINAGGTPHSPEEIARVTELLANEPVKTPAGIESCSMPHSGAPL